MRRADRRIITYRKRTIAGLSPVYRMQITGGETRVIPAISSHLQPIRGPGRVPAGQATEVLAEQAKVIRQPTKIISLRLLPRSGHVKFGRGGTTRGQLG
jgi:hypothetical protein